MASNKVLPFTTMNYCNPKLSILIVMSMSEINKIMLNAFKLCEIEESSVKIECHQATSIQSIMENLTCSLHFDFIVFVVDTRLSSAIDSLHKNIQDLDKHFLLMSRICIVASNELSYEEASTSRDDLHEFASSINCPLLCGSVFSEARCPKLAQRITNLAATVTGVVGGIPMIMSRHDVNPSVLNNTNRTANNLIFY